MKSFFVLSAAAHGALLFGLIVVGTLLSKPRMSYYAVDLFSAPAGGGPVANPAVSPVSTPPPAAPKAIKVPKAAPSAPRAAEEELPDQDTIRMLAKLKKKRLGIIKSQPRSSSESRESSESETPPQGAGRGGAGMPGAGAGIVAEAGPAFPYPWYLKAIADRLDKQWHPPQEFAPDTLCQVTFVISGDGQISGSQISKSSGDAMFDQLALRAVVYSNPLPPLPNGYPDPTLKVHMKFVGKRN